MPSKRTPFIALTEPPNELMAWFMAMESFGGKSVASETVRAGHV